MSILTKTDEEYYDLLGMFGSVLNHVGGKVEVPFDELKEIELSNKELTTKFDAERNVFVFELKEIPNE